MKKRRQWTTYSGSGKRVAPRTRTSRVSRGKEMGVPRLWVQLIVCGALFVALIGLKLLMPGNLSALRGTLGQWLVRDADFISAFSAVGRAASGEQDWGDSLSEAYVAVFGGESKAQEVSGNLIGMTVSEQDVSDLTSARELPALAVGLLAGEIADILQLADHAPHLFAAAACLDGKACHGIVPVGREAQHQREQPPRRQCEPIILRRVARQRKIPPLTYNDPCVSHSSLHPNRR